MKLVVLVFAYYFVTLNSCILEAALINSTDGPKATMKRRCVVDESELKDLLTSECFVDKSLIIKDFLNMKSRFASVLAPRRFGKTVNMKILKTFLQPDNGLINSNVTDGCKVFINHDLNIFTWNATFFQLHCGKYPVIYINFKKIAGNSFNDVLHAFTNVMHDSILEHAYLLNSTRLRNRNNTLILLYMALYSGINLQEFSELEKMVDSIARLPEIVHYHFSKNVTVLIDDFDSPIWKILSSDFPVRDITQTIYFIRYFMFKFIENNRYVERALINNCLELSRRFLSNPSNIDYFYFLENHPLVKYYGLTEDEVREKLNYFNILRKHGDVKFYYNGYKIQDSGDSIYSTWSVMNYLQTEHFDDYWITTAGLHNLSGIFVMREVRRLITQLLKRQIISIGNIYFSVLNEILNLRDTMRVASCNWRQAERFLLFLTYYGYFYPTCTNESHVSLNIPNNEIYQYLYKQHSTRCRS